MKNSIEILTFIKYVEQETLDRKNILEKLNYFDFIITQISFMKSVFDGGSYEHAKLHDINVGLLAFRELESWDSTYAHLLAVLQYIADKKGNGLIIDLEIIKKHQQ